MAVTVSIATSRRATIGAWKVGIADVTMDSSYPTGGEALDPTDWGLTSGGQVYAVFCDTASGYVAEYDYTLNKLKVLCSGVTTGGTAAAADSGSGALAVNAAGAETVVRMMDTVASTTYEMGPFTEVANATDLSTVVFRVMMIGD